MSKNDKLTTTSKPGGASHAKSVSLEAPLATSESEISSSGLRVVVTSDSRRCRGGPRGGALCMGRLGAGVGLLVIPDGPAPGEDPLCCEHEAGGHAVHRTSSHVSGFSIASRSIYTHNDGRVKVWVGITPPGRVNGR